MSEPAELLAGRVARGDDAAAEELVEAMRPLVSSMATRFQGRVPRSDLEQAGVVGLLRAAATFDAERGTPFGGYAAPFVMGEMLACVRQLAAPVRVPRSVAENERAVATSVDLLTSLHGRSPTVAEIAEQAKLGEEAVLDALRASMAARPVSLDEIEPERFGETDETLEAVERRLGAGVAAAPARPAEPRGAGAPVRDRAVAEGDRGAPGHLADARVAAAAGGDGRHRRSG